VIYLELFLAFLKVGLFTFGGAYGAIPLIRDAVLSHNWLTEEVFSYFLGVAESTPGPIMVNMATYVGSSQAGFFGSVISTFGVVLPSFVIMLLVATILKLFISKAPVKFTLVFIKPCIAGVILAAGLSMLINALFFAEDVFAWDLRALIIGVITVAIRFVYKKLKKSDISPILLIVIAAVLGVICYGV